MIAIEEKRENIVAIVRTLPEDQLDIVKQLLQKIELLEKDSVEYLFAEAVSQYGNTLKKLAE